MPSSQAKGADAMDEYDDLITPREAARLVRCHVSAVYRWLHRGQLQGYRRGPFRFLVRKADVLAMLSPVHEERPAPEKPKVDSAEVEAIKARLRKQGLKV
jgi:excisionase family DNA binding protein